MVTLNPILPGSSKDWCRPLFNTFQTHGGGSHRLDHSNLTLTLFRPFLLAGLAIHVYCEMEPEVFWPVVHAWGAFYYFLLRF